MMTLFSRFLDQTNVLKTIEYLLRMSNLSFLKTSYFYNVFCIHKIVHIVRRIASVRYIITFRFFRRARLTLVEACGTHTVRMIV